jgi:hypothetical protein
MTLANEAERLRKQAQRALRLARAISDDQTASALKAHATILFEQAERLEQQPAMPGVRATAEQPSPIQQQQQIQPKNEDHET